MFERKKRVHHADAAVLELDDDAVVLVDVEDTSEVALPEAPPRRRFLPGLLSRLPKPSPDGDPSQRRAGLNILRFLALILIITFVARGTAGATMPKVATGSPTSGEIVRTVAATGAVTANGTIAFEAPEELTIQKLLVTPGQQVEQGEAVAQFGVDEVNTALERARVELEELNVLLNTQTQSNPRDTTGVAGAQQAVDWAQQDAGSAVSQRDAAAARLETARQTLSNAQSALAGLAEDADPEQRQAAQAAVETAQAAVPAAEADLAAAEQRIIDTARGIETAKQALASAQVAAAQEGQAAANEAAQNAVDADKTRLDIADKEAQIGELEALASAEGKLTAPQGGLVQETADEGTKTDGVLPVARILDPQAGFLVQASVPEADAQKLNPGDVCQAAQVSDGISYVQPVEGSVLSVGKPDESGHCAVRVRLPQGEWKQGQNLQLNTVQNRQSYGMCLPLAAVYTDNAGSYVFRIRQDTTVLGVQNIVERVPVTVVDRDGKNAAVEGAVGPGDKIITDSSKPVNDGDKVRLGP